MAMERTMNQLLAVARGDEPADRVLRNARVVHLATGEVEPTDVALCGDRIAGLGPGYRGCDEIDLGGRYLAPGLIDAHVHIESSLVAPVEFARAVVPRGVTTVITDPHEIANVRGLAGIRTMLRDAEGSPLEIFVNASSCVPASPLGTSGATLEADDLATLLDEPRLLGLAEVMNFPGVVAGDAGMLAKLARFAGRVIDGHAPALSGHALSAYAASGISSDHECTTADEAREKLRRGLVIFLREATNARNLDALLPLLTESPGPMAERRICFCTDDRVPRDLLDEGSVDAMVRRAITAGVDPFVALRLATLNPADHYRLSDRGLVAPGRRADLMSFADLRAPEAETVWIGGEVVATAGTPRFAARPTTYDAIRDTVQVDTVQVDTVQVDTAQVDFRIPATGGSLRVIGLIPDQLLTRALTRPARIEDGLAVADPDRDLAKLAVVERHGRRGGTGLGFVEGFGLRRGALAGTVAHDHHNLIVVGLDDLSMRTAARAVIETGGGLAVAEGDTVIAHLPLPLGGLMSDQSIESVRHTMDQLLAATRHLGSPLHDPFMALSFLGLEVIPQLKLTDQGLVDVERFEIVPLFV